VDAHLSHPSSLALAAAAWLAMTTVMMTPAVAPWVRAYATLIAPGPDRAGWLRAWPFVAGYAVVWAIFATVMAAAQATLADAGWLVSERIGDAAGGVVLMGAGAFQFTALKAACLSHCRNPLGFLLARWHDGAPGGFRLGASHGLYCLGCCWLLMITGFALGVMNLLWMAVLAAIVALEQAAPRGPLLGRLFGGTLIAMGARQLW
jgi:predicted metal-binding membrane protein